MGRDDPSDLLLEKTMLAAVWSDDRGQGDCTQIIWELTAVHQAFSLEIFTG